MAVDELLIDLQVVQSAIVGRGVHNGSEGVHQFHARAVIQGQREHHARVLCRCLPRPFHALLHCLRQLVTAADILQADVVLVERGDFGLQVASQQAHEEVHLAGRALFPILRGKGIEGERRQVDAGGGFYRRADGRHPGAVSGDARQVALPCPAPVAVHDNRDVSRKPFGIELGVDLRLFAVQSCGCVQGYLGNL